MSKGRSLEVSLFSPKAPLAERMRPASLEEFVGQRHLLAPGRILSRLLEGKTVPSLILWGPPGCGKTTLARLIAQAAGAYFVSISAVTSGVKELKEIVEGAERQALRSQRTVLFIDEIHRFNRAQQDFLLPHVETGLLTLIGATTENPSFQVIAPLLSRAKTLVLKALEPEEIEVLLFRALKDSHRGLGSLGLEIERQALEHIILQASGDARVALNSLELAAELAFREGKKAIDLELVEEAVQRKALLYDRQGEEHYNLISAFHKSLRGSDPDAALYWMARMLAAGEDPLYIARRMIVCASEDIGNADPQALLIAVAAKEAYQALGQPEGELALAQAAVYLACAPKSNAVYLALKKARSDVKRHGSLPVPLHIRNAPTELMRELGYGQGYRYAHDWPGAYVPQEYFPDKLKGRRYYEPTDRGQEAEIKHRLWRWRRLKEESIKKRSEG